MHWVLSVWTKVRAVGNFIYFRHTLKFIEEIISTPAGFERNGNVDTKATNVYQQYKHVVH